MAQHLPTGYSDIEENEYEDDIDEDDGYEGTFHNDYHYEIEQQNDSSIKQPEKEENSDSLKPKILLMGLRR